MIDKLSIVIPALNEEESIPFLLKEIDEVFLDSKITYEIVLIDDFSTIPLEQFIEKKDNITIIRNEFNQGQSKSIFNGILKSTYPYICTLDGDGQNPPSEILKIVNEFNKNYPSFDAVVGFRKKRNDNLVRKFYSKIANYIIRLLTKSNFNDLGCSLKVFKKKDVLSFNFSGDIHRILNILLQKKGLNIKEVEVEHHERKYGISKYGFSRILPVIVDSILIMLTKGFNTTPRYVLGKISFVFLLFSIVFFSLSLYQKYFVNIFVHRNPIFLLGVLFLFIAIQIFIVIIINLFIEITNHNKDQ